MMSPRERIEAYHVVFSSQVGQEVLQDLYDECCMSVFHPNPTTHAYNQGKHDMVMSIINLLSTDPSVLMERIKTLQGGR